MRIYYNKMMEHVLHMPDNDDPIAVFSKTYNMKDCIFDIAKAWESVDKPLIHKFFVNLLSPDSYLFEYNVKYHRNDQWTGLDFRGFPESASDASDAKLIQMHRILNELHNKQNVVLLDVQDISEAVEYDPNRDLDISVIIQ